MTEAEQDAKRHRRRIAKRKQKLTKAFEMLREVVGTEAAKRELETLLGRAPLLGEIRSPSRSVDLPQVVSPFA
jgi:hypothetical protein